jgi:tetratricopeptide (TPR) repeat protein
MDERISVLFRELVDLPPAAREEAFVLRNVPPELRAEVESLLACDASHDHSITECIAEAAQTVVQADDHGGRAFIGRYRPVQLLGSGGMGSVFLAERVDGEIQQRVAIKMLHVGASEASWQERFLRERQLLAYLNHPCVARLLDAGRTQDGQPYLVMEYVDGVPIDVSVEGRSVREKLTLFLDVCEGVAYAHGHLIIHRDLKPSNILVDQSGQPKLLDFGIAKLLAETADQTRTVERLLTPGYASPEQIRGTIQTTATDIYSLGAVLYKMLTGRSPHESETGQLQAVEVIAGVRDIPPARRLNPALPRDIDCILQKALRTAPEERYVSVEAFANDIRAFLDSRPVTARSASAWYRTRKFVRRYRVMVAAAALTVVGLSAGLYVANRERLIAQRRFSEVRQIANKLFEIDQSASQFAGSTKTRQLIADTALEYLRRLADDAKDDTALAVELANAYAEVARIQGGSGRNLGQTEQAAQSLRVGEGLALSALQRQPANRHAMWVAARIAGEQMLLASLKGGRRDLTKRPEVLRLARKAEGWLDKFNFRKADLEQGYGVLNIYLTIANQLFETRQFDDALRVCHRAAEINRISDTRDASVLISSITAQVYQQRGDLDDALSSILESVRMADRPEAKTDTTMNLILAHVLVWKGRILGQPEVISLGRSEEAAAALENAFRITDEVVHAELTDPGSRVNLGVTGALLGEILRLSDARRALEVYDHALSHLGEIQNNDVIKRSEVETLAGSSYALVRLGRSGEARKRLDLAFERLKDLKLYPAEKVSLGSVAYKALRARSNLEAAGGRISKAIEIDEKLIDQVKAANMEPETSLEDAVDLSNLYRSLAELHVRNRDAGAAAATSALRLQLWQRWQGKLANNAFVRRQLAAAQY